MTASPLPRPTLSRRTFIVDLGRGAFALALVSLAGCAGAVGSLAPSGSNPPGGSSSASPAATSGGSSPPASASAPQGSAPFGGGKTYGKADGDLAWKRADMGFVSAYLLVRAGEATLVDTGVSGRADDIEAVVKAAGLTWGNVAHVILTHSHNDHVGSAAEVLKRASNATGYAGAADIRDISGMPRPLVAVGEGDRVMGLRVVTAPGHTPGQVVVHDPIARLLVAGDSMGTSAGKPILPSAPFTPDMAEAKRSIAKLGALGFETLLVGHGEPITSGAAALVAELGRAG